MDKTKKGQWNFIFMILLPIKIKNNKKNNKGFTLVEAVVYIGILGFMMVALISSFITLSKAFSEIRHIRNVNHSAVEILDRISFEIKSADAILEDQSLFDDNQGMLNLIKTENGNSVTVSIFINEDSLVEIEKNGQTEGVLSGRVLVQSLIFRHIDNDFGEGVKMELSLLKEGNNPKIENFYLSSIIKGKY